MLNYRQRLMNQVQIALDESRKEQYRLWSPPANTNYQKDST